MRQKIRNTLSAVLSVAICVFLVLMLVVIPFYYSITALTKPQTVVKIIQDIDYEKLIEENKVIKQTVESFGLNGETADKLIKSEQAGKLIELYADEAIGLLMQIPSEREWNSELIKEVIDQNMDRIVEVAEENTTQSISKNLLRAKIDSTLENNEELINKAVPILKQVKIVVETVKASELIERTMSAKFAVMLGAVFIIAVAIVCLLRRRNFKGFLWLTVSFIVAVLLLAAIVIYSQSGFINMLAVKMSDFGTEILTGAISVYADKLIAALLSALALALVFIVIFVLGYNRKFKKELVGQVSEEALKEPSEGAL